ncbi:hypothetical protein K435DRAFT_855069 [Dendrothele bispora CBS 962.96]|uniref:F-box domain-containing protein n=1 Tax=Dendrothele bispora (strain CBS 962.96) TaxID=1314807 RepID=A0A4S8MDK1_DENBC|nr:hypothetical protein K435DRAFT_855069 [Dendrothele bispora CBS 962.96]
MSLIALPFDVLAHTTTFLDNIIDVTNLGIVTNYPQLSRYYLFPLVKTLLSFFVPCPSEFLDEMESWGGVITGSSATWIGIRQERIIGDRSTSKRPPPWQPRSLDLLVQNDRAQLACMFFIKLGYSRKAIYNVDKPWTQSSSLVTELQLGDGPTRKRVFVIHLKPVPSALYLHLVCSPATLDMTAFSSTTWLCMYPRLFQLRQLWLRRFEYTTRYADNIRWRCFKQRGFQPVATNRGWLGPCVSCPSSWRSLAGGHNISSSLFRVPKLAGIHDRFFQDALQGFLSTVNCSLAWQFSEACFNDSCSQFTVSAPDILNDNFGLCSMGVPRSRVFTKSGQNERGVDGLLFDLDNDFTSVVKIPFRNNDTTCLDDLLLDVFLDNIPRGVYCPARYRSCVVNNLANGYGVTIITSKMVDGGSSSDLGSETFSVHPSFDAMQRNRYSAVLTPRQLTSVSGSLRCIYRQGMVQIKSMAASASVLFQPELFAQIVAHANLHDFLAWRSTCKATREACADFLSNDLSTYLNFWCPDRVSVAALRKKITEEDTVAVGAVALALLRLHTLKPLSNLHLVCPITSVKTWWNFANGLGWQWCGKTEGEGLKAVRFVTTKKTMVTLTGVYSDSPIHFVSDAAESALVTFVSGSGVYCGYPNLTFNKVTFSVREIKLGFRIGWNCLKGFRYDNEFVDSRVPDQV